MSYSFNSKAGQIRIQKLSFSFCCNYSYELLNIINIIPHINWSKSDLLSQNEDYYGDKWNYSYVIFKNSEIIGVLISYFRLADDKHIFDSLYLHRFAIKPEYQNLGIGTEVIKYFIQRSFEEIPWLLNISAQTNLEVSNIYVINFYKKLGFKETYNIVYPNKTDILLLLEHKDYNTFKINIDKDNVNLKHPRLSVFVNGYTKKNVLPIIYFSSTNEKKKEIVSFIFNNYNIDVSFIKYRVELTEPQIEDVEEESKLVSFPLKSISRFINNVPYTIEDTMLFVEYFNRNGRKWELPGLDTKRWFRQIGVDGLLDILGDTSRRKAVFVSQTGAYIKANDYYYGRGEIRGRIAYEKATVSKIEYGTYPYFFHLIFIPEGSNKTLAEMNMYEYAQYDYMRKSIKDLINKLSKNTFEMPYTLFDYIHDKE